MLFLLVYCESDWAPAQVAQKVREAPSLYIFKIWLAMVLTNQLHPTWAGEFYMGVGTVLLAELSCFKKERENQLREILPIHPLQPRALLPLFLNMLEQCRTAACHKRNFREDWGWRRSRSPAPALVCWNMSVPLLPVLNSITEITDTEMPFLHQYCKTV